MSGDDRTAIDRARFQLEFMALMIQSGRGEDAATAYNRVHQYLDEAATELDRLQGLAPNPERLDVLTKH